ncbi:HU family DNA-binding protein [Novilysobacter spongiicola]|uniref:Viral histone-like protein n=1 Tax=Lysobacter spongiicola DSM 21749 TaxID=1122188 RepID=A0A1T4M0M6_9GAMM|nr:HU family DNA-binding protein [Lysobacter spongiicola]SJZ60539.1 nucleoid DNA-binding protein [Lysobacter spongiicola DSM 21749]
MAKAPTKRVKPITEPMNKTQLIAFIAERTELSNREVRDVLSVLDEAAKASLHKKGAGQFTIPGLLKITSVKVPAKPRRKGINPFTKEEQVFAAKPASIKIKVRPLKALKDAAN